MNLEGLNNLIGWQFVLLALCVAAVMSLFKSGLSLWKDITSPTYKKVILPGVALGLGCLMGMASSFLPMEIVGSVFDRGIFGLVAGAMSTLVFRAVKKFLGSDIEQ